MRLLRHAVFCCFLMMQNEHIHQGEVTFLYQDMTESFIANGFMEEKKNSIPLVINDSKQCSFHGKSRWVR